MLNIRSISPTIAALAAACLCWAIDNNLTREVSAGDPFLLLDVKGLFLE